jgi:hypothetical protein
MNIEDTSTIGARKTFRLKPYIDAGYGVAVFVPFCFLLMVCNINPYVATCIAIVPAFALYYYRATRLILFECLNPACKKDINTNTPWKCGFKGCENYSVNKYPFIYECEHCHYPPKSYICHHCGSTIFLTSDRDRNYAAKRLNPVPVPVKTVTIVKDVVGDKIATQRQYIRDLEHEKEAAALERDIKEIKSGPPLAPPPPPATTPEQKMFERLSKEVRSGKSLIDWKREELEKARQECGDDDQTFSEMERVILHAAWREEQRRGNRPG